MNAYKRRGLTWSDVLDNARDKPRRGHAGRLALSAYHLFMAAHMRRMISFDAQLTRQGRPILRDVSPSRAARSYLLKAREWRLELQGAK